MGWGWGGGQREPCTAGQPEPNSSRVDWHLHRKQPLRAAGRRQRACKCRCSLQPAGVAPPHLVGGRQAQRARPRRAHRQQPLQRHRVKVHGGGRCEGQAHRPHAHLQPRKHRLQIGGCIAPQTVARQRDAGAGGTRQARWQGGGRQAAMQAHLCCSHLCMPLGAPPGTCLPQTFPWYPALASTPPPPFQPTLGFEMDSGTSLSAWGALSQALRAASSAASPSSSSIDSGSGAGPAASSTSSSSYPGAAAPAPAPDPPPACSAAPAAVGGLPAAAAPACTAKGSAAGEAAAPAAPAAARAMAAGDGAPEEPAGLCTAPWGAAACCSRSCCRC